LNDVCASSGSSKLFALFYKTGSAYQEPIIGTSASGTNQNVNTSVSIGAGLAFGSVAHMGTGAGDSPFQLLTNMSQGNFDTCETCQGGRNINVAIDPRSLYFSWINM
jgi:type IV pilus assembly protein PilY1